MRKKKTHAVNSGVSTGQFICPTESAPNETPSTTVSTGGYAEYDLNTGKMRTIRAEELFNDMRDELRDLHNKVDVLWRESVCIENGPPKPAKLFTVEQVAQMLYEIFEDECPCNFNGNDEWLPEVCEYCDSYCPNPPEKLDCWKQFVLNFDYKRQFDNEYFETGGFHEFGPGKVSYNEFEANP